jgi:ATP/maltotriose-dependent transcriptional regulator MalT
VVREGCEASARVRGAAYLFPIPFLESVGVSATLSAREWKVARLVATGMTNREIPATLTIALTTARTELGFSRRSQIAAWIAGQG